MRKILFVFIFLSGSPSFAQDAGHEKSFLDTIVELKESFSVAYDSMREDLGGQIEKLLASIKNTAPQLLESNAAESLQKLLGNKSLKDLSVNDLQGQIETLVQNKEILEAAKNHPLAKAYDQRLSSLLRGVAEMDGKKGPDTLLNEVTTNDILDLQKNMDKMKELN